MTTDEWDCVSIASEWSILSKAPDDDACSVSSATTQGSQWSVLSRRSVHSLGSTHSVQTLASVHTLGGVDAASRRESDAASLSTLDDCQSDAGSICTELGWPRLVGASHDSGWEAVNRVSYREALLQGMEYASPVVLKPNSSPTSAATATVVPASRGVVSAGSRTSVVAGRLVLDRPRTSVQIRMRGMRGKTLKAMALIDEMMEGANDGDAGDVWGTHDESEPLWLGLAAHDDRSGMTAQAVF